MIFLVIVLLGCTLASRAIHDKDLRQSFKMEGLAALYSAVISKLNKGSRLPSPESPVASHGQHRLP